MHPSVTFVNNNTKYISIDTEFLSRADLSLEAKGMAALIASLDAEKINEEILLYSLNRRDHNVARSAINELAEKDILFHGIAHCSDTGDVLGSVWCFDTNGVRNESVKEQVEKKYRNKKNLHIIKQPIVAMEEYVLEFAGRVRGEQNISRFIEKTKKIVAEGNCRNLHEWNKAFLRFMRGAAGENFISTLDDSRIRYLIKNAHIINGIIESTSKDLEDTRKNLKSMSNGKEKSLKAFIREAKKLLNPKGEEK